MRFAALLISRTHADGDGERINLIAPSPAELGRALVRHLRRRLRRPK